MPSDGRAATVCYQCDEEQAIRFGRYLAYATIANPRVFADDASESRMPLHALLTQALAQFTIDYEAEPTSKGGPSLAVWSNLLKVLGSHEMTLKELGHAAITASRTTKVVVKAGMDIDWIDADPPDTMLVRTKYRLSESGRLMQAAGKRRLSTVTTRWLKQYGSPLKQLFTSLQKIDSQLELEYPNYITGYGPADESLTGGSILPKETEPIRIPERGMEWPVVPRVASKDNEDVPISTLLSRVLTQFALDYEGEHQGRLGLTTLFHQYLPDEGMQLSAARKLQSINGKGTSLHERHLYIVIEPGKPTDGSRLVYPTQKSRIARDAYPALAFEIEKEWETRFGYRTVANLRNALENLQPQWDSGLPDYPNTTAWMSPYFHPYCISS